MAETLSDIIAADDEVLSVIRAASNEDVDVWIVGVPVIDRDPIQPRAEIPLHVPHQLASESTEVGHLAGIFGRDREAEMMPVILAAFGKSLRIGGLRGGVEHARILPVAGYPLTLEISDMFGEWRRVKPLAVVADDPRHDDNASARRSGGQSERRAASSSESRSLLAAAGAAEALSSVTGPLGGPHHLADEGLRTLGAPVAVPDMTRLDAEVIVAGRHGQHAFPDGVRRRLDR